MPTQITTNTIKDGAVTAAKLAADTSAWKLVESQTASASASLTFSTGLTNYGELLIKFIQVAPSVDGANLRKVVSIDGGSSFVSSNYTYIYASGVIGDSATAYAAASFFRYISSQGNAASEELSGSIKMTRGSASIDADYEGVLKYETTAGQTVTPTVKGWVSAGGDVDALRFTYDSGNIASGTITIYGR